MTIDYVIDLMDITIEIPQKEVEGCAIIEYANTNGCKLERAREILMADSELLAEWCDKVEENEYWQDELKEMFFPMAEEEAYQMAQDKDNDFNLGLNRATD